LRGAYRKALAGHLGLDCPDFLLFFLLSLWYILHGKGEPPYSLDVVSICLEILPFPLFGRKKIDAHCRI